MDAENNADENTSQAAEDKAEAQIREERSFIHDISSPLMIAMGMIDFVNLKIDKDSDPKILERLAKAQKAMDRMNTLLKERRRTLIELMEQE